MKYAYLWNLIWHVDIRVVGCASYDHMNRALWKKTVRALQSLAWGMAWLDLVAFQGVQVFSSVCSFLRVSVTAPNTQQIKWSFWQKKIFHQLYTPLAFVLLQDAAPATTGPTTNHSFDLWMRGPARLDDMICQQENTHPTTYDASCDDDTFLRSIAAPDVESSRNVRKMWAAYIHRYTAADVRLWHISST